MMTMPATANADAATAAAMAAIARMHANLNPLWTGEIEFREKFVAFRTYRYLLGSDAAGFWQVRGVASCTTPLLLAKEFVELI